MRRRNGLYELNLLAFVYSNFKFWSPKCTNYKNNDFQNVDILIKIFIDFCDKGIFGVKNKTYQSQKQVDEAHISHIYFFSKPYLTFMCYILVVKSCKTLFQHFN